MSHSILRVIFMAETVLSIVAMVLCVAGAVSIIKWTALKVAASDTKSKCIYAVLLDGNAPDIRLQMAFQTVQWENALSDVKVYAVDGGLDGEMAEYCRELCERNAAVFVSGASAEVLKGLF